MKDRIIAAKNYVLTHKKDIAIATAVIIVALGIIISVVTFVRSRLPQIDYDPIAACDLFTLEEAQSALGDATIKSGAKGLVLSGSTAASECGYADGNADVNKTVVAAVIVRSAVNDKGTMLNKTQFVDGRPTTNVEIIEDLGDSAYFNQSLGQLNILDGREWIVLSYGVAAEPTLNTSEQAVELARKALVR